MSIATQVFRSDLCQPEFEMKVLYKNSSLIVCCPDLQIVNVYGVQHVIHT